MTWGMAWAGASVPPTATPSKAGFWYRCDNCSDRSFEVYGHGRQCWCCRRRKILVKNASVPGWTAWHRHDPTRADGDTPSCGHVSFEGPELASLI